jgi:hypothetical protein
MVKGIELFRTAFAGFADSYILIGGAACDVSAGTCRGSVSRHHDLDIVLCVEALTPEFGRAFWRFIQAGGYFRFRKKRAAVKSFYRFRNRLSPIIRQCLNSCQENQTPLNLLLIRN